MADGNSSAYQDVRVEWLTDKHTSFNTKLREVIHSVNNTNITDQACVSFKCRRSCLRDVVG
ncbi:hypothetical protein BDW72DRAFT_172367 [Aspergillus terricola var. indicus]